MIEQNAIVIALDGQHAIVEVQRQSACGQCAANKGCGTSVFANWFGDRMQRQRALNQIHATVGEQVVVGINENALLKLSVLCYLLPLFCMVGLAIFGRWLLLLFSIAVNDGVVLILAVIGLVLGWMPLRFLQRNKYNSTDYQPTILRRQIGVKMNLAIPVSKEF